jgi:hypothetical protein
MITIAAYLSIGLRDFLVNRETGDYTVFSWVCFGLMIISEIAIFVF